MSYQTATDFFYGFPIDPKQCSRAAQEDWNGLVEVHLLGSDGEAVFVVHVVKSLRSVPLGNVTRLADIDVDVKPSWASDLAAFCERHGITMPTEGPGWHVGPRRS